MYLVSAVLLLLLAASALLGFAILLIALSHLRRPLKRRLGEIALMGGLLGTPVGIGLLLLMFQVIHNSNPANMFLIFLWGASGFGWGGITAVLTAKLFNSPDDRGWAGLLLGCEAIAFLVVGLIIHGYANA